MRDELELSIRRARPADKRAVNEICRHIWGGNDYLPDVFDEWVRDRRGGLWLACVGDRPIGVAKLTLRGDREAWLHALRVHPRFRRRGVGAALIAHRLARAETLGARIARLDTSDDNTAVRRLMRRFGFRRVTRYSTWIAPATRGEPPRRATLAELPALLGLRARSDGMLHEIFLRRSIDAREIARDVRAGRCVVEGVPGAPRAMASVEPDGDRLRLRYLAGGGAPLVALLRALPAAARLFRKRRVRITVAERHWRTLHAARYRRAWSGSMLLFEKRL